jgi:putative acetyltransferase
MKIRRYEPGDLAQITALFYDTVHAVNAADYSPEQLDAWADGAPDRDRWNRSLMAHHSLVAVEGEGLIVGFGDIDGTGYLDRLYVHRDRQGQGIATALLGRLERAVDAPVITTHASITARPFFEARGYRVIREQWVERHGVRMTNFVMEKRRQDG